MAFRSIRFQGFRNLENGEIKLGSHDIFLVGNNGQGKTNFLEALYLLSYGSSFRTHIEKDLIAWGYREMSISGKIDIPGELVTDISISIKNGVKTIKLNGKNINDRKELLKQVPTIIFVHDDIFLSTGAQEKRRWFIDQILSLLDSYYVDYFRRYKKLLRERNFLLKKRMMNLIDHFEEQLVDAGLSIIKERNALVGEFGKIFSSLYQEVSRQKTTVSIEYKPSWGQSFTVEAVRKKLKEKMDMDLGLGITSTGPHRDKFVFLSEGRDFSKNASTGQNRLLSLVLRVAQAQYLSERTKRKPILLMDDVMLELDVEKRERFRQHLPEAQQVFYTFLPGEETIQKGNDFRIYEVNNGGFYER